MHVMLLLLSVVGSVSPGIPGLALTCLLFGVVAVN